MSSDTSDTSFGFSTDNETPIHTVDDMEGQKDETDECVWYCEITRVLFDILIRNVRFRAGCSVIRHFTHDAFILLMLDF